MRLIRRFWPVLILTGIWLLFFWRFFAPAAADRVTYPPGDFTQQFGVFRDVAYRSLVAGRLPLWADCLEAGYPFHADPQAQLFYPPAWLAFAALRLLGWGHYPLGALVAEVALHYWVTALFLYLFLRRLALRRAAAVLGAVVFTYGGYLTGSPPLQMATLAVDTWLPLALLLAHRLAVERRRRDVALLGLVLAVAFLAGHPQTFVYVAGLTLAYFAYRARACGWPWRRLSLAGAQTTALTSTLAAVQLLPSLAFIRSSTRAAVAFEQAGHGFPFADVLQFFLTGFVSYWHPLYVGLLPLGLAALALAVRGRAARFWAGAALVGLVLSFGTKAAAYDVAYWTIPGWRLFRGQEHLALVVSFALAVLAAYGADAAFGPLARRERRGLEQVLRLAVAVFVAALLVLAVGTFLGRLGYDPSDWRRLSDRAGVMLFAAGLALVALAMRARGLARVGWTPALFVSVVVLDLFAANRPLNVVPSFQAYPYNPLLDLIRAEAGFFRVQDDYQLPGHAGCAYGYRAVEGVTPYRVASYAAFSQAVPEPLRWQLLGVRYVVSWRAELYDAAGAWLPAAVVARGKAADEHGNATTVHRLDEAPRRAWLVHTVWAEPALGAQLARLAEPGYDPWTVAVVPRPVAVEPGGADMVDVLADEPGRVRLSVAADGAALLVLSEAYASGWQARVDGGPAEVVRADAALLGVPVPAGEHVVELNYRPATLALGGLATALSLAGAAVLAANPYRRVG